jgi:hypothetical protein
VQFGAENENEEDEEERSSSHRSFAVNLGALVGMLQVFGPLVSASARLAWRGYGSDLMLVLHEAAMRTECSLRTLDAADEREEADGAALLHTAPVAARITVASDALREAFAELDWSSAYCALQMSPAAFRLSTSGPAGSCAVDFTRESALLDLFECSAVHSFTYRLNLLAPSVKGSNKRLVCCFLLCFLSKSESSCFFVQDSIANQ